MQACRIGLLQQKRQDKTRGGGGHGSRPGTGNTLRIAALTVAAVLPGDATPRPPPAPPPCPASPVTKADSLPLLPSLTRFPPRPTSSPAALSRRRGPAPAAPALSPAPAPIELGGRSFRLVCFASLDLRLRFSVSRVRSEPRGDASPPADLRSLPPVPAAPTAEFRRRSIRVLVGLQFHITSASELNGSVKE
ncbi:hypothetical protein EJB05_29122, partial [Eragrostis curvula]